jgi:hypothetical protein
LKLLLLSLLSLQLGEKIETGEIGERGGHEEVDEVCLLLKGRTLCEERTYP